MPISVSERKHKKVLYYRSDTSREDYVTSAKLSHNTHFRRWKHVWTFTPFLQFFENKKTLWMLYVVLNDVTMTGFHVTHEMFWYSFGAFQMGMNFCTRLKVGTFCNSWETCLRRLNCKEVVCHYYLNINSVCLCSPISTGTMELSVGWTILGGVMRDCSVDHKRNSWDVKSRRSSRFSTDVTLPSITSRQDAELLSFLPSCSQKQTHV